jgi:hypothetical protein
MDRQNFGYGLCISWALEPVCNPSLFVERSISVRALILIAAIILLMALVGWVTFGTSPGRSSINVETDQIREDTREALESGANVLHKAEEQVRPDNPPAQ